MKTSNEVEIAELAEVEECAGEKLFDKIDPRVLKGIEVEVKVALGKKRISVDELMKLSVGSVLELDTSSSQYLNLCVGEEVVAKGMLVVADGHYGLQIMEIAPH